MRLLVLGGTRFVGRAVVTDALDRGWDVDAVHRGRTGTLPRGARSLTADRTDVTQLRAALGDREWDLVVDTWAQAPYVVRDAAQLLRGRAQRFGYVSTCSVYRPDWPAGDDESGPVVDGDPDSDSTDYAADKRGGELAVLDAFPDALLARAGVILGPHEDVGRLPWWLTRIARGGRVVAPGRPERPWQYVDVRDLARWLLDGLAAGLSGPVDSISASGHATTGSLLEACVRATGSDAQLVWVSEERLAAAGVEPWTQLPAWLPESGEGSGFMSRDTSLAARTGLACRPVQETVDDTWEWVRREGAPPPRPGRPPLGLPAEAEAALLASQ